MAQEMYFFEMYYEMDNAAEHQEAIERAVREAWPAADVHDTGVNSSGNVFVHVEARPIDIGARRAAQVLFEHFGETIREVDGITGFEPKMAQDVGRMEAKGEHVVLVEEDGTTKLGLEVPEDE